MSVLSYKDIKALAEYGSIEHCHEALFQPASLDVETSGLWYDVHTKKHHTSRKEFIVWPRNPIREFIYKVTKFPFLYRPTLVIAETVQWFDLPLGIAADIKLKSTPSRKGLDVSMGGWIDPGYHGTLSLVLRAYMPVTIKVNEPLCQIVFMKVEGGDRAYTGKYQNSLGPVPARGS